MKTKIERNRTMKNKLAQLEAELQAAIANLEEARMISYEAIDAAREIVDSIEAKIDSLRRGKKKGCAISAELVSLNID
jgi:uncharacterized protein YPO0396